MEYKYLIRGEISLVEDNPLEMGLDTCVGIIIYGESIVGASHGSIPEGMGSGYENKLLIVPEGIKKLVSLIISRKESKQNLKAIIFGGRGNEILGVKNSQQAEKTLEDLRIPLIKNFTRTPTDQIVRIYKDKFEVKAPNFPHVYSREFAEMK